MDTSTQTGRGSQFSSGTPLKLGEEIDLGISGIKKKLVKIGVGKEPKVGDEVFAHIVGTFSDGSIFYSASEKRMPLSVNIGQAMNSKILEECVLTMKEGEHALFTVPSHVGGHSSVVHFTIELILLNSSSNTDEIIESVRSLKLG